MNAPLARGKELVPGPFEPRLGDLAGDTQLSCEVGEWQGDAQMPRRLLEIGRPVEPPVTSGDLPFVRSQQRLYRSRRPDVELPFLVLAVGIEARTEGALGRAHVAQRPGSDSARRARAARIPGCPPGIGVYGQQRGVVVEHLLEVRDGPFGVDAVAAKPAAELVV